MSNDTEFSPAMHAHADELTPFDVRDSSGRQGLVKLLIGFGSLLLIALIGLKLYQPGVRDRDDPPKITAENTPFKVPPANAGGAQTPDQDKVVFDVMDGKTPNTDVRPAPLPEVPIKVPSTPRVTAPKITAPRVSAPKPVVTAPTRRPAPTPTTPVRSGASDWVVQVASTRSQNDAENVWNIIQSKYGNMLGSGTYSDIKRVDLAEKGIYFRTRVAGLADKSAAQSLCNNFKAAGQACFVARR